MITHKVTDADLATAWRNDVPVVATPILIWLCELAAMEEIKTIDEELFTVGFAHECEHVAGCGREALLEVEAQQIDNSGGEFVFDCTVRHRGRVLLRTKHTRKVVDKEKLINASLREE